MTPFGERLYLSTIADDACALAREWGLGLELADFCAASNMDEGFPAAEPALRRELASAKRFVFHAPFSELCPAAVDPLAVELARKRYRQAAALARRCGAARMVVHSGYIPLIYYKSWFLDRSVGFWRDFLRAEPDLTLLLENVMEDSPELPAQIAAGVDDPRFRLCLDVGHANTRVSDVPPEEWVGAFAPYLAHVHLHSNDGDMDLHAPLGEGTVDVPEILRRAERACPDVTYTVENMHAEPSVRWLAENGYLRRPKC